MIIKLEKEGEVLDHKVKFYSEEFKEETVKLVLTSGKSQAQIGRELGVNCRTISTWVRYRPGNQLSKEGSHISADEKKELIKLRRDFKRVEMERDILKKAVGIFTKELP